MILKDIEENSERWTTETMERKNNTSMEAADPDSDEDSVDGNSPSEHHRKQIKKDQEARLDGHRKKKAMLRRRRHMRSAAEARNAEPTYTGPTGALEHLQHMDLDEGAESELPAELFNFGSLGLSGQEAAQDKDSSAPAVVDSWDERAVTAARQMCKLLNTNNTGLETLPLLSEAQITKAFSDNEVVESKYEYSRGVARPPLYANAQPAGFPYLNPLSPSNEMSVGFIPSMEKFAMNAHPGARPNLLCAHPTCPIDEPHYEGPYYYNNILADQDHPWFAGSNPPPFLWEAYRKSQDLTLTRHEDDMLHYFWLWHVPPFCYVPDHDEDCGGGHGDADGGHRNNEGDGAKHGQGMVEIMLEDLEKSRLQGGDEEMGEDLGPS